MLHTLLNVDYRKQEAQLSQWDELAGTYCAFARKINLPRLRMCSTISYTLYVIVYMKIDAAVSKIQLFET